MNQALIFLVCVLFLLALLKLLLHYLPNKRGEEFPYRTKKYFFSRSEDEFFKILYQHLDHTKYNIFPKVRLADFIELSSPAMKYKGWWNRIKSRHIDFLIWNNEAKMIALAIELDGKSHTSESMVESDNFKNKLYEKVGIPLVRIRVGTNFDTEVKNILEKIHA